MKGRAGVYKVVWIFDRAPQEFSNALNLWYLSGSRELHRMHGECVFEMPGHGKGPCDGIGAGLKRMLGLWAKKRTTIPTVNECVDYL